MRGSLLLVGMVNAALYVTVSFAFEASPSDQPMDVLPARLLGNADADTTVVRSCTSCHAVNQMENSVGPHLVGVLGRRAGAVSGYSYSDAMRHTDLRWTRDKLRTFLVDPQSVVPGTAMPAALVDDEAADAVVNYLARKH